MERNNQPQSLSIPVYELSRLWDECAEISASLAGLSGLMTDLGCRMCSREGNRLEQLSCMIDSQVHRLDHLMDSLEPLGERVEFVPFKPSEVCRAS